MDVFLISHRRDFITILLVLFLFSICTKSVIAAEEQSFKDSCELLTIDQSSFNSLIENGNFRYTRKTSRPLVEFDYDSSRPFSQYLRFATEQIKALNPRSHWSCDVQTETYKVLVAQNDYPATPNITHLVAPFELKQANADKAILLIHGLTDSPYLFHDLAFYFYNQGFSVRTLLLPGHGTAPSGLVNVELEQWQQATEYAIERTLKDYKQLYLGGFSTGGGLIFDYLMSKDNVSNNIKGLLMWSPASRSPNEMAWLAKYVSWFADWLDEDADIDVMKYESFPFNAGAQVYSLMDSIMTRVNSSQQNTHNIPLFVATSKVDQTIDANATLELAAWWHDPKNLSETSNDMFVLFSNNTSGESILPKSLNLVQPTCDNDGICRSVLNVSHVGVTNSPNNPHYGEGKYRNCSHYVSSPGNYFQCKTLDSVTLGETTAENRKNEKLLQRVTFNPFYNDMLGVIDQFLENTASH